MVVMITQWIGNQITTPVVFLLVLTHSFLGNMTLTLPGHVRHPISHQERIISQDQVPDDLVGDTLNLLSARARPTAETG